MQKAFFDYQAGFFVASVHLLFLLLSVGALYFFFFFGVCQVCVFILFA